MLEAIERISQESAFPVTIQNGKVYSTVLNLLGINKENIHIEVDAKNHEFGVYATKKDYARERGFYWIFSVPMDALLERMRIKYKGGGLEIRIPKQAALKKGEYYEHRNEE